VAVLTRARLGALAHAVLALAGLALGWLALGGCYRPELQDCTVSCAAPGDCASGQVCADGWCTAPDAVCGAPADARLIDATPADAALVDGAPIDAEPPGAELHVVVDGRGKVVIDPLGEECIGTNSVPGDCTYPLEPGSVQTLLPVETSPAADFDAWTTANCENESGACIVTVEAPVTLVGARFQ
jgi:hypothetical protein